MTFFALKESIDLGSSNTQAEQIGQIWWQVISSDGEAEEETEGEKLDKEGRSLVWVSGENAGEAATEELKRVRQRLMHAAENCNLGNR